MRRRSLPLLAPLLDVSLLPGRFGAQSPIDGASSSGVLLVSPIRALRALLVLAVLAVLALPALADRVVPSSSVVHWVNVRSMPQSGSARIGALRPGESAELIGSTSSYYKVRLASGKVGFVVKSWTEVVPEAASTPMPLLAQGHAVEWWFVFKFNTASFPQCSSPRTCPFGGEAPSYPLGYGLQFAYASSESPSLEKEATCLGETTTDPVGATFAEVYNGNLHYVIWNDQLKGDPEISGCSQGVCSAPWGHSKGLVAWNDAGDGFVMQVTTPSWPAAGSHQHPRLTDGNTLGCTKDDNVLVSQHFFAVKLTPADLRKVLQALENASIATDPSNPQVVNNGGPADIQQLVNQLGHHSQSRAFVESTLSTGVVLVSKPSDLHVPPWQFVSAVLGDTPLLVATWWHAPKIDSTDGSTTPGCWDPSLSKPGAVQNSASGEWEGTSFGLLGTASKNGNHAKLGVSTTAGSDDVIFGDLNQQGYLSEKCDHSQNGRGGTFYVLHNRTLHDDVAKLLGAP